MHRLLWENRFLIQSMRSEKVSQWRQPSSFLIHQGREDAAYQTEKNSYANILGQTQDITFWCVLIIASMLNPLEDASASFLPACAQSAPLY